MTASDREALRIQLMRHEGVRLFPYVDTVGKLTIGVGRNLTDRGISDAEVRYLLDNDITTAINSLTVFPWFPDLDPIRQRAFVDLAFNLGLPRLRGFTKMLAAAERNDWGACAAELGDSRYAHQVGQRAQTLAAMLRTGTEA
jgi:lysozyme